MTPGARKQLRHLFRVLPGATPVSHHPDYWGGDIRWATPEDLGSLDGYWLRGTRRTLTCAGYRACAATLAPANSLLVTKRAPIGEIAVLADEACCNQGCFLLVPKSKVDTRFYYYWFSARAQYLRILGRGSTFMELDTDALKSLRVPHPSFRQQRTISNYLDGETTRLNALMLAKQKLIAAVEEKRHALITRAVTQGMSARSLPHASPPPAHWKRSSLKRVLRSMDYGMSIVTGTDGSTGVLRMGNLQDGEIDYSELGFVDNVDASLLLNEGDLLFNRTNSLEHVGKVALFRGYSEYPISFSSYLVRLRCGSSVLPDFLNYLLNSAFPRAWSRAEALPSIGQANLSPRRFGYLPIAVPPLREQRDIVSYLSVETARLRHLRAAVESAINLLQERRTALIHTAVAGGVDGVRAA